MLRGTTWLCVATLVVLALALLAVACGAQEPVATTSPGPVTPDLTRAMFAVPGGTIADQLVRSKYPQAEFTYYDSALDCALAVKAGEADAAAYDEPILRNIAAKNPGLVVLPEKITVDNYGYAVALDNTALKAAVDEVIAEVRADGTYEEMIARWLPAVGSPSPMPSLALPGGHGVLRFGTAPITEPFSFVDGSGRIVGFDIEMATHVARRLGKTLKVVNMDFAGMIPAVAAGEVDMAGACLTISAERARVVLFSAPYYESGIAALVRE